MNLSSLPITHRAVNPESYIDLMGHMNVMWYTHLFSQAACGLFQLVPPVADYLIAKDTIPVALLSPERFMANPNRLLHETSLYLKQHANNPVDWYPWGPEALARSRELDRPIFLSIGYSACHWCHVMEHESFEDEETARILNEHYVCIKVDREERPDLDTIYMNAPPTAHARGRRLAAVRLPHAGPDAVLRRDLLSARRALRPAPPQLQAPPERHPQGVAQSPRSHPRRRPERGQLPPRHESH